MKIIIENFGPIKRFDFDLDKDLHVIYGENNIGKSYAINLAYVILKNIKLKLNNNTASGLGVLFAIAQKTGDFKVKFDEVIKLIEHRVKNEHYEDIKVTHFYEETIQLFIERLFLSTIKDSIQNSFPELDKLSNKLSDKGITVKVMLDTLAFTLLISNEDIKISNISFDDEIAIRFTENEKTGEQIDNTIFFYLRKDVFNPDDIRLKLRDVLFSHIVTSFDRLDMKIDEVFFLPASRSGLYQAMSNFGAIFAELSQARSKIDGNFKVPNLSDSVSDYFLELSSIKSIREGRLVELAGKIETEVLSGQVLFDSETKKISFLDEKSSTQLSLSQTSSMVAEISPIVAFLKYVIEGEPKVSELVKLGRDINNGNIEKTTKRIVPQKLLFIEEPEAHLHPKVQVKLMEIFAELAQNGVKVVLTTHSDFIFNKLTNLILANKIDHEKVASYHLVMGKEGSYDTGDMKATAEGIDDHNFLEVAEALYEERIRLEDQKNDG